ncbi:Pentatricopeptide repeat-containing protein At4g14050, mitochondrial [Ancistrocladus abbreviatus]
MLCSHYLHHLGSCAKRQTPSAGKRLHAQIIKNGLQRYGPLPNTLIDMYGKCGLLDDAFQVFDEMPQRDYISWASILTAHNHANLSQKTLTIFPKMWKLDRLQPDHFVIASLVKACASLADVRRGKQVHAHFIASQFYDDDVVKSSLVDMYAKCGWPDYGRLVFDSIGLKNPISWTAMISGYARSGRKLEAIELFWVMPQKNLLSWSALISGLVHSGHLIDAFEIFTAMKRDGGDHHVDPFIISSIVGASANMATLELGKQVHCLVIVLGFEDNLFIANALVDMYAKCSDILAAKSIFSSMPHRDVVSWTSIIVGTAQHGQAEDALALYNEMMLTGIKPNQVTFLGLIYACSHVGLVSNGRQLFNSMIEDYGIKPSLQHYTSLLDLLSRSGHLDEAHNLLKTMPYEPDEAAWAALLSACKQHKNSQMGVRVADCLLSVGPKDPSTYILLSNTYAAAAMWESVSRGEKTDADCGA